MDEEEWEKGVPLSLLGCEGNRGPLLTPGEDCPDEGDCALFC